MTDTAADVLGHAVGGLMLGWITSSACSWQQANAKARAALDRCIPEAIPRDQLSVAHADANGKEIVVAAFCDSGADYNALWIADEDGVVLFRYEN